MMKTLKFTIIILLLPALLCASNFYGRVMTFHGDPDTCTTITGIWNEAADSMVIEYSTARDLSGSTIRDSALTAARCHMELDGLTPNTWYYYTISDGFTYTYISDTDSFKTANVKGTSADLTFWIFGDTQIDSSNGASLDSSIAYVARIRARLDAGTMARPDLILHCGDHVEGGLDDWRAYFAVYDTLFELTQFLSISGSHDGYAGLKVNPGNWMFYFNIMGNGLSAGWNGDQGWVLYYENIAFIATDMINKSRNYPGDSVTVGSSQYNWLEALCEAIKVDSDIDYVFELHGSDVTPMPWKVRDGAIDNRTTTVVLPGGKRTYWDGNPELYWSTEDTIKYEYVQAIRPLLVQDSINAISFESGGWYCTGQPLEVIHNYWDDCPIFECSGTPKDDRAGVGIATINSDWFTMRVEKLQTFPMAELYDDGYPFTLGATFDNYPIFSCPNWNKINGVKLSVTWGR